MMLKHYSHSAIVFNYFYAQGHERDHYHHGNRIFYDNDTLYSYGRHFPLAERCRNGWILNGDTYSPTTSGHQTLTRQIADLHRFTNTHIVVKKHLQDLLDSPTGRATVQQFPGYLTHNTSHKPGNCPGCMTLLPGHDHIHHAIIPYSSLTSAHITPAEITILDSTHDTYEHHRRRNPKTQTQEDYTIHHLGAALFRIGMKRYLSSIDQSSTQHHAYYLVELRSRRINTIEDAYRDLAGALTDLQYQHYQEGRIQRQGEYYLEPHPTQTTKQLHKKALYTPQPLPGVLSIKIKTPRTKQQIRKLIHQHHMGYGGVDHHQLRVLRNNGVSYYILMDQDHMDKPLPSDAYICNGYVMTKHTKMKNYDLSHGVGNPHIATEAIRTPQGFYIRKTLRHPEHRMIRMGAIWHRVYPNTARHSWTAHGRVD
jgi:hypothetical protein